jgi:hypothetical protein
VDGREQEVLEELDSDGFSPKIASEERTSLFKDIIDPFMV